MRAPALRSGLERLYRFFFACHAAWTSIRMSHGSRRVHAKVCTLHAPVPPVRLLPGKTRAEIGPIQAQYACARHGMLHECRQQHPMSCKKECMHKHACCVHLCRRAGCCQAGLGAGTVSFALEMRARGMICCMSITHGISNDACMPNSGNGNCRRVCASPYEDRRNRRFSKCKAQRSDALHDACT